MIKLRLPTDIVVNVDPSAGIHYTYGEYLVLHCGPYNHYFNDASRTFLGDRGMLSKASEAVWSNFFNHLKQVQELDRKELSRSGIKLFEVLGYGQLNLNIVGGRTESLVENSVFALTHRILSTIPSRFPVCEYSEGYISAFLNAVLNPGDSSIEVVEEKCGSMGHDRCIFRLGTAREKGNPVSSPGNSFKVFNLPSEELKPFLTNLDKLLPKPKNGLLFYPSIYNEFSRLHISYMMANYYSIVFHEALKRARESNNVDALMHLYSLAAIICIVSTFGSFAGTPIFSRVIYPKARNPFEAVFFLLNLSGMGRWELVEYSRKYLEYRVYNFYELNYQLQVEEPEPVSPFLEGAGMAVKFLVENMLTGIMKGEKFNYSDVLSTFSGGFPYTVEKFEYDPDTNAAHVVIEGEY